MIGLEKVFLHKNCVIKMDKVKQLEMPLFFRQYSVCLIALLLSNETGPSPFTAENE